jgi:ABC-2 type transport system permease protein
VNTLTYAAADSATMLRRNIKHMLRYPSMTVTLIAIPVIFLLLFVYVLGGTVGAVAGLATGRAAYASFIAPGIIVLTVGATATSTAVSVATDMTEGIIARFRTMAIARVSLLTGHVGGAMIQTVLAVTAVIGIALVTGFRSSASAIEWIAAIGVLLLFTLAVTWLSVALGLAAKTVEAASNAPMPLAILPFLGSGFAPTHSMPTAIRWFAEYQPFTPVIDTVRGLLEGTGIGTNAILAIAWSLAIAIAGYLWARKLFARDPSHD